MQKEISNSQLDQVKSLIKEHLEKNKFFETLKSAVAKDPRLASLDRNAIIEKLKSEGILNEIMQSLPVAKRSIAGISSAAITPAEVQTIKAH